MKRLFTKNIYFVVVFLVLLCSFIYLLTIPASKYNEFEYYHPDSLVRVLESKTFDIRQRFLSKFRYTSNEIVIIALDNASLEFMTQYLGYWPMPRKIFVDMIEFIESAKPRVLALDINFVGDWEGSRKDDINLANCFKKYNNLFTGLYFDNNPINVKKSANLPERHSSEIKVDSSIFAPMHAASFRLSYDELLQNGNFGVNNFIDHTDGITRALPMFVSYYKYGDRYEIKGKNYYPNLGLKIISRILNHNTKQFGIDSSNNLIVGDVKIPMLQNSESILNWYRKGRMNLADSKFSYFNTIPFKKVFIAMQNAKRGYPATIDMRTFKDKIVLFGLTADSLYDLKSTPVDKQMSGVEVFGVFTNNFIDNSFIKKVDTKTSVVLSFFILTVFFMVFYCLRTFRTSFLTLAAVGIIYIIYSYHAMYFSNLWVPVMLPVLALTAAFVGAFFLKYFIKIKDFENLSKLINTDDLTGLYNKRFFNENMHINMKYSQVYKKKFAIIMIDIDHFKNFNDTYGHLLGDFVLKQTASLLMDEVGETGIVCRYGGEEMVVILPQADFDTAQDMASRLCKRISESNYTLSNNINVNVTISLGFAVFPDNAISVTKLVEYADKGLYWAKEHGRNQVGKME